MSATVHSAMDFESLPPAFPDTSRSATAAKSHPAFARPYGQWIGIVAPTGLAPADSLLRSAQYSAPLPAHQDSSKSG